MEVPPPPGTSWSFGSPNGSGPDLDGTVHHAYDAQFKELRDMLVPLVRGFRDFENHVKTIGEVVGLVTSRVTNVEQRLTDQDSCTFATKRTIDSVSEVIIL